MSFNLDVEDFLPDDYKSFLKEDGTLDIELLAMVHPDMVNILKESIEFVLSANLKPLLQYRVDILKSTTEKEKFMAKVKYNVAKSFANVNP